MLSSLNVNNKPIILNLEWHSHPARDRQISTLIANYLRFMGYTVVEDNIFNGCNIIKKLKPSLLFVSNATGGIINHQIVKYAKSRGVKILTSISEGILTDKKIAFDDFFWGWNKEKILFADVQLLWSYKTLELTLKNYPELRSKTMVSGGVGFDVYRITGLRYRNQFLNKYNKISYSQVIGVGCWDFVLACPQDTRYEGIATQYSSAEKEKFRNDRDNFNEILLSVIKEYPNILFLLKEHPGTLCGYYASAIDGCEDFPNVLILKDEEPIVDCIAVSDFWVVYDSTTALESWLLDKQTAVLNPGGTDFKRDDLYRGSSVIQSTDDFSRAIDCFYDKGILPGFNERKKEREILIENIIQYADGLNHVRAGNAVIELLETKSNEVTDIGFPRFYWLKFNLRWILSPYLKRYRSFYADYRKSFDKVKLKKYQEKRYNEQLQYYEKCGLSKNKLKNIRCSKAGD